MNPIPYRARHVWGPYHIHLNNGTIVRTLYISNKHATWREGKVRTLHCFAEWMMAATGRRVCLISISTLATAWSAESRLSPAVLRACWEFRSAYPLINMAEGARPLCADAYASGSSSGWTTRIIVSQNCLSCVSAVGRNPFIDVSANGATCTYPIECHGATMFQTKSQAIGNRVMVVCIVPNATRVLVFKDYFLEHDIIIPAEYAGAVWQGTSIGLVKRCGYSDYAITNAVDVGELDLVETKIVPYSARPRVSAKI